MRAAAHDGCKNQLALRRCVERRPRPLARPGGLVTETADCRGGSFTLTHTLPIDTFNLFAHIHTMRRDNRA
jgi:hypothetical protein